MGKLFSEAKQFTQQAQMGDCLAKPSNYPTNLITKI
jgi:hypothetical protein